MFESRELNHEERREKTEWDEENESPLPTCHNGFSVTLSGAPDAYKLLLQVVCRVSVAVHKQSDGMVETQSS